LFAAALGAPVVAQAGDATLAESLFREGKRLMAAGDYAKACPKLSESYAQDPATGTLLALAVCFEDQGKLASAWTTYSEVAARAHADGRADREQAARDRVGSLAPRLSTLTIEVPESVARLPGFALRHDGKSVPAAAWGSPVPVDGGDHVVEASASGKNSFRRSVRLAAEADRQSVRVPELEALAIASPTEPPSLPPPERAHAEGGATLRTTGIVVGGLGLVGLSVGAVFGIQAKKSDDASKENGHCDESGCDATGKELRDDAFSQAGISTACFIAGGVLLATGITLYIVGGKRHEPSATSLRITPSATNRGASLSLAGSF
jgi:hypothetical protein